jgi:hypothetical protein
MTAGHSPVKKPNTPSSQNLPSSESHLKSASTCKQTPLSMKAHPKPDIDENNNHSDGESAPEVDQYDEEEQEIIKSFIDGEVKQAMMSDDDELGRVAKVESEEEEKEEKVVYDIESSSCSSSSSSITSVASVASEKEVGVLIVINI